MWGDFGKSDGEKITETIETGLKTLCSYEETMYLFVSGGENMYLFV